MCCVVECKWVCVCVYSVVLLRAWLVCGGGQWVRGLGLGAVGYTGHACISSLYTHTSVGCFCRGAPRMHNDRSWGLQPRMESKCMQPI